MITTDYKNNVKYIFGSMTIKLKLLYNYEIWSTNCES